MSINRWIAMGRLTGDPERRQAGTAPFTRIRIAVSEPQRGQKKERTLFIDVDAFYERGDEIAERFRKGDRIVVVGRLREDTWEKDGQRRQKFYCLLDDFEEVEGREAVPEEPTPAPGPPGPDVDVPF